MGTRVLVVADETAIIVTVLTVTEATIKVHPNFEAIIFLLL